MMRTFRHSLLSATLVLALYQTAASANPFRIIEDALNTINRGASTLDNTTNTLNRANSSVDRLLDSLGLSSDEAGNSLGDSGSTDQVLAVYEAWYGTLSTTDKETVSWLIMQHARNQTVTFETISTTDWFMQKPIAEQSQVSSVFFKLQQVIDASADDRDRFLAFAFCVNSGAQNCEP